MEIVAVDWSGRPAGAPEAIWLARTDAAGKLVELENGRDRDALVNHLIALAERTPRLVVGLDFAFGFPSWFSRREGWESGPEIWKAMDDTGDDLLARCEPPFWGRPGRPNPNTADEGLRRTELGQGDGPQAKSVFQIGGAGAVGTGSVRGMAQLHRLAAAGFVVWPFVEDDGRSPVVVEIYPRRLTGPVNKSSWRTRHKYVLDKHGDQPEPMRERAAGSQDAFDAAVSAIVMHRHREILRRLPRVPDPSARLEGRIWAP